MHNELNKTLINKPFHANVSAQHKKRPKTLVTNNPKTLFMILIISNRKHKQ